MNLLACPSLACSLPVHGPETARIIRSGFYRRSVLRGRRVQRFKCKSCGIYFSSQTFARTYRQRRPDLNEKVRVLLSSQVSQRRCAKVLGISKNTVVQKFRFMAREASVANEMRRRDLEMKPIRDLQFDDLITSVHTKCKPLSVSLAVDAKTREILAIQVSDIPARHPLREISLKKYGPRYDERPIALNRLFYALKPITHAEASLLSDLDPEYPRHVLRHLKTVTYRRVKSRRARSGGFGELKRIGFDPLFSLNHTCAMLRANLNRLARRTWCTSKTKIGLLLHLELYAHFHNTELISRTAT